MRKSRNAQREVSPGARAGKLQKKWSLLLCFLTPVTWGFWNRATPRQKEKVRHHLRLNCIQLRLLLIESRKRYINRLATEQPSCSKAGMMVNNERQSFTNQNLFTSEATVQPQYSESNLQTGNRTLPAEHSKGVDL